MAICDWPEEERPREKLLARGPSALSDAELLAIFLRTGVKGLSAIDLARGLQHSFGSMRGLLNATQEQFCAEKGLGVAKFVQLKAVLELARRHLQEQLEEGVEFTSPQSVRDYLSMELRDLPHEVFQVLFLDNRHRLIVSEAMFSGTIDSATVHVREVVKRALTVNAAALIIAHNHPSGVAEPSRSDVHITERIADALALVSIRLLDHFVVGSGEVRSLVEAGLFKSRGV